MNHALRSGVVVVVLGALTLPAAASAKPGSRSFQETYPVASKLCAESPLPGKLQSEATQVASDCTTLQSSYNAAVTAGQNADASFASAVAAAKAKRQAACVPTPTTTAGKVACLKTRLAATRAIDSQRVGLRLALRQFHLSIEQARVTFWTAIHGLRGGAGIPADKPDPNAPIPSSS